MSSIGDVNFTAQKSVKYLNTPKLTKKMETKEIKAKYEKGHLVPLEKVNLKEGEIIEIEISVQKEDEFSWEGALKDLKLTSVELQHKLKEAW